MSVEIIKGNLFTSDRQTLVNTVNCVGIMGAGIALEFRFRYPVMFERYSQLCKEQAIEIGKLWIYKPPNSGRHILNFPTKKHWRNPSKLQYLESGLAKFLETYEQRGIKSAAFPVLGASKGGIPEAESLMVMQSFLERCTIPIDIYRYDPATNDDLYISFKTAILSKTRSELCESIGLRANLVDNLCRAVENGNVYSISQLASQKGVGMVTLEKSFRYLMSEDHGFEPIQKSLL